MLTNFLDLLDSEQQKRGCQNDLDKTVIQHVFGSKVCSSVLCLKCKRVSRTIDPTDGVMLEVSFNRKERGLSTYFRQVTESHTRVGHKTGKNKPQESDPDSDSDSKPGFFRRIFSCNCTTRVSKS